MAPDRTTDGAPQAEYSATGAPLRRTAPIGRAGARTHSTLALALGAAEHEGTRRAVLAAVTRAVRRTGALRHSREVLTPVAADPPSLRPALAGIGAVLAWPAAVGRLAGDAVDAYAITPATIARLHRS